jgi:hypothetical protein
MKRQFTLLFLAAAAIHAQGLVLLEEHTATGASSINFTSCIGVGYNTYQIELEQLTPSVTSASLLLRLSTDGGVTFDTANSYPWTGTYSTRTGITAGGSDAATAVDLGAGGVITNAPAGSGLMGGYSGHLYFSNPLGGVQQMAMRGQGGFAVVGIPHAIQAMAVWTARYLPTAPATAFQVLFSTGTVTGTARCYGLAK